MEIWGVGVRHISNILVPSEKDIYVYEKPIDINITIPDQKGNHYSMQQVLEGNVNIAKPEDNFHAVFSPYSELINCEGRNIPVLIFAYVDAWYRIGLIKIRNLVLSSVLSGINLEVRGRFNPGEIKAFLSDNFYCDKINIDEEIEKYEDI